MWIQKPIPKIVASIFCYSVLCDKKKIKKMLKSCNRVDGLPQN